MDGPIWLKITTAKHATLMGRISGLVQGAQSTATWHILTRIPYKQFPSPDRIHPAVFMRVQLRIVINWKTQLEALLSGLDYEWPSLETVNRSRPIRKEGIYAVPDAFVDVLFWAAHRFFCAADILALASRESLRRFRLLTGIAVAFFGGRPRRFAEPLDELIEANA